MKKSLYFILLLVFVTLFFSCNRQKINRLEADRARMLADSIVRDSILNDMFSSFNDIEENLSEITSRQKFIADVTLEESPENKDIRDRIGYEIATINDMMIENDNRIQNLKEQLKSSNIKIKALEETIAILNKRLEEKDLEIINLKEELLKLNIKIEILDRTVADLEQQTEAQKDMIQQRDKSIDQLNKVYYVAGTNKYLKDNEIIEKTGFLGSAKKLSDKVETGLFVVGDQRQLTSIEINSEKAKLITVHPDGSYVFVNVGKVITELKIKNTKEFWKTSKFCVIETR